jgi:serine-type D-Ala-D-Ala carboxypeptidase/endopeptidase
MRGVPGMEIALQPHIEAAVDPQLYDGYVGRYQLAPAAILTVTRSDNRLFAQLTGFGCAAAT